MTTRFTHPFYRHFGYFVWLILLLLSVIYYKERAFFMDAGFQLFNLINEESIQIYHHRFVTGIPQLLPFLLLELNAPLWLLGMSFSASYILLYLIAYHVLVKYLKNDFLGWTLIFLFTLISLDTFYHIQSEFYIGLTLLLVVFGVVLYDPGLRSRWQFPLLLPLLIAAGFSHKLSLVFFIFLWVWFFLNNDRFRHWRYFLFLALFLLVAGAKNLYFTNWYEAAKQVDFRNNWAQYFPNFFDIPANRIFLERSLYYYYWLPLLLMVLTGWYAFKKTWLKIGLIWAFFTGFLLLYNISDPYSPYRFYAEVTYLPLTIFLAVPFLFDLVPVLEKYPWLKWMFVLLVVSRIFTIIDNRETIERKYSWINKQFERKESRGSNRLLLKKEDVPLDTVLMEWGVPFTSMHLSALRGPAAARTILIMPEFKWYEDKLSRDDLFFSPFHKVIETDSLNRNYYDLGKGMYQMPK